MATTFTQPARSLPVFGDYDVVGGQRTGRHRASVSAAHGALTLLVERYGFLGGMGTAGGVTNFAGLDGKRGGEMAQLVHGLALHAPCHGDVVRQPLSVLSERLLVRRVAKSCSDLRHEPT